MKPPRNLYVTGIRFTAVLSAVGLSREFIRQTLQRWQLTDQIDSAVLIGSELVTNAVKMTGVTHPEPTWDMVKAHHVIGVQLRLVDTSVFIEVWDRGSGAPEIPEQSLDAEGGRGLFLVESLSKQWGICRPAVGGKVVWAELVVDEPLNPPPLKEALPNRDPGSHGPLAGEEWELVDAALMQRVLDGFGSPLRRDVDAVAV